MTTATFAPEHDHQQCVSKALGTAEHLCLLRGVQLTPIRHQVLELIWSSHKAVKAYDLLDLIKPLQQAAKPATIYRALDFLIEQGLIHRVESLNAFVGCRCSDQQHEQLLLICSQCQEVEERSAADVMKTLAQEAEQAGFVIHSKAVEIHGVCGKCASKVQS
ncbi:MAG: transcriptional repressor [Methylococcales bacterium]|nr:transcriptional repressor [Methylococcaceae bacterium]